MKKLFIIAAVALVAMCACTKNDSLEATQDEISFAVATFAGQTKADDYATNYGDVPFGAYAWFYENDSQTPQEFMVDETVALNTTEKAWKPAVTYYWPKTGSIDFISYSPKDASNFVDITTTSIKFGDETTAYDVEANPTWDLMYADKAFGQTKNIKTYYKTGVPTLFRHALSNINVNIKAAYTEKVITEGSDATTWVIKVDSLRFKNFFKAGTLDIALNAADSSWTLPSSNVWKKAGDAIDHEFKMPADSTLSTEYKPFVASYYVLPQLLGDQTIEVVIDIETTLPNNKVIKETGVKLSGLMSTKDITSWGINKQITYNLIITPAADDPSGNPIAITFDPAVEDWSKTSAEGKINLAE